MNWNHLYCFYEVAKSRSIKEASKNMSLAASTVSEHVKNFENSCGLELFDRSNRDLKLTRDGDRFFQYAKKMFSTGKRLEDLITFRGVAGYDVKVGIEHSLSGEFSDELIAKYWQGYSKYGLVETTRLKNPSQAMQFLEHDVVDIALSTLKVSDEHIECVEIAHFESTLLCSNLKYEVFKSKADLVSKVPIGVYGNKDIMKKSLRNFLAINNLSAREVYHSDHRDFLYKVAQVDETVVFMNKLKGEEIENMSEVPGLDKIEFPIYALYKKEMNNLLYIQELKKLVDPKDLENTSYQL